MQTREKPNEVYRNRLIGNNVGFGEAERKLMAHPRWANDR